MRPRAEPLLRVDQLRIELPTRRGALVAVDQVTFAIAAGEVLGLIGESGAGKSLTGAAIIGMLEPPLRVAAGEIRLAGRRLDDLPDKAMQRLRGREIGAIFQDPLTSLDPLYTVGAQLIETIRTHLDLGVAEARRHALDLLREVGIAGPEQRFHHYPHQLSGGMRQRVVIALALAAKPSCIIADEPTTALDVSVQGHILALLRRLCRENAAAVLLVTHDLRVIAQTADRAAVMYAGRIVEIGPARAIIDAPQHPYTAALMQAIPRIGGRGDRMRQIEGTMPRLGEVPQGCPFHPRCPSAFDRCRRERPELMPAGTSAAACWLFAGGTAAAGVGEISEYDAAGSEMVATLAKADRV
ncbi:MAG: ABC transporter ATP-binding protein [Alphaproteobacteria bacterium]|nr:ABC transporter ATP-binding protein [Alphaproteobacteria bacterium]